MVTIVGTIQINIAAKYYSIINVSSGTIIIIRSVLTQYYAEQLGM